MVTGPDGKAVSTVGRPKKFDVTLKVRITRMQDASLDVLSEWTGLSKSDIIREMLNSDFVHGFFREGLHKTVQQGLADIKTND